MLVCCFGFFFSQDKLFSSKHPHRIKTTQLLLQRFVQALA